MDWKKVIKDYLDNFAKQDNNFAKKYNKSKIDNCCQFIINEAKKKQTSDCAVLTDPEVFSLAVHFFDESIECDVVDNNVKVSQTSKPKPKAKKPIKKDLNQLSLFEL